MQKKVGFNRFWTIVFDRTTTAIEAAFKNQTCGTNATSTPLTAYENAGSWFPHSWQTRFPWI